MRTDIILFLFVLLLSCCIAQNVQSSNLIQIRQEQQHDEHNNNNNNNKIPLICKSSSNMTVAQVSNTLSSSSLADCCNVCSFDATCAAASWNSTSLTCLLSNSPSAQPSIGFDTVWSKQPPTTTLQPPPTPVPAPTQVLIMNYDAINYQQKGCSGNVLNQYEMSAGQTQNLQNVVCSSQAGSGGPLALHVVSISKYGINWAVSSPRSNCCAQQQTNSNSMHKLSGTSGQPVCQSGFAEFNSCTVLSNTGSCCVAANNNGINFFVKKLN